MCILPSGKKKKHQRDSNQTKQTQTGHNPKYKCVNVHQNLGKVVNSECYLCRIGLTIILPVKLRGKGNKKVLIQDLKISTEPTSLICIERLTQRREAH